MASRCADCADTKHPAAASFAALAALSAIPRAVEKLEDSMLLSDCSSCVWDFSFSLSVWSCWFSVSFSNISRRDPAFIDRCRCCWIFLVVLCFVTSQSLLSIQSGVETSDSKLPADRMATGDFGTGACFVCSEEQVEIANRCETRLGTIDPRTYWQNPNSPSNQKQRAGSL